MLSFWHIYIKNKFLYLAGQAKIREIKTKYIFTVYLMAVQELRLCSTEWSMNRVLDRVWKEVVMSCLKVSYCCRRENNKIHETTSVSRARLQTEILSLNLANMNQGC
jgi:hypothetical protein